MSLETLALKARSVWMRYEKLDLQLRLDAIRFSLFRADYYRFLADMIEGTQGAKSLLRIFQDDANRFPGTPLGRLSERWAHQFARGGNLSRTFNKTLPAQDVAVIATAQEQGDEEALIESLRELAANTDLQRKALGIVIATMLASTIGLAILMAMVLCTPGFIIPKLKDSFSLVPSEDWPITAARLFSFSDFVASGWPWIVLCTLILVGICYWSLGNLTGPLRLTLDKYGLIWGMYRDFQSIRTLSSLATAINQKTAAKGLRESVAMQLPGASRWKRYHLEKMLAYVDSGADNTLLFTTGTLDSKNEWYLQVLIDSRGLQDALMVVKTRLEERIIKKLTLQSLALSWVLIVVVIGAAVGLMLWVYAALDGLSAAQQNLFY
jgi:type II secretory pathway component PulF